MNLSKAKELIEYYHAGQRYDQFDYTYHLYRTLGVAMGLASCDTNTAIACLLHDILEDTKCTIKDLVEAGFDYRVIDMVVAVTDPPGKNRKERKKLAYVNIEKTPGATLVKLCDRIANVEHNVDGRLYEMYKSEQKDFETALRKPNEHDVLWNHLNNLLGL